MSAMIHGWAFLPVSSTLQPAFRGVRRRCVGYLKWLRWIRLEFPGVFSHKEKKIPRDWANRTPSSCSSTDVTKMAMMPCQQQCHVTFLQIVPARSLMTAESRILATMWLQANAMKSEIMKSPHKISRKSIFFFHAFGENDHSQEAKPSFHS